jgi:uncharacterized protein YjiK
VSLIFFSFQFKPFGEKAMSIFDICKRKNSGRLAICSLTIFLLLVFFAICTTFFRLPSGTLQTIMPPTPLQGIRKNLSGLTWNAETKTFFATTNNPEYLYELSIEGRILQSIRLLDFEDTEGVTHLQGSFFGIVEERKGLLNIVNLSENATGFGYDVHARVALGRTAAENKGFEGLSYDPKTRTIFTMREGRPFVRFDISLDEEFRPITIQTKTLPQLKVDDVASLVFSPDGHFWILSEDSRQIVELDTGGAVLRRFDLDTGSRKFQPEGITFDADGLICITGEPNILAVYRVIDN